VLHVCGVHRRDESPGSCQLALFCGHSRGALCWDQAQLSSLCRFRKPNVLNAGPSHTKGRMLAWRIDHCHHLPHESGRTQERHRVRIAVTHNSRNPKRPRSAAERDRGYGGWARRPSAEAAEAPKDSSSTCETWPKCNRRARLELSNLRDEVRSTACMPRIGVTKASIRPASRS
jgi:hypothetical protein